MIGNILQYIKILFGIKPPSKLPCNNVLLNGRVYQGTTMGYCDGKVVNGEQHD